MKSITILWGLPGSGKTTYAEEKRPKHWIDRGNITIINGDSLRNRSRSLIDLIVEEVECAKESVIIDSLITTNDQADHLMTALKENKFHIIYWDENRPACLWNDRGRRSETSSISIKNMPFEKPSEELKKKFNATVERMDVIRKPSWMVWANENGMYEQKLTSLRWSLGGTSGNCWNDQMYSISADPQPTNFSEFDSILEKVCPQIGFMVYKRIYSECVKIETTGESDYYGGNCSYAHFECDLELLYEKLVAEKLISPVAQ
jgi:adenylate kinase family enzyme